MIFFILGVVLLPLIGCETADDPRYWPSKEWPKESSEQYGVDASAFGWLIDTIESGNYRNIHSLLVVKEGHLVVEEYFFGYGEHSQQSVYDISQTVMSALVGIAVDQGDLPETDHSIGNIIQGYDDCFSSDARKRLITIQHLLIMETGLEWDEDRLDSVSRTNDRDHMHNAPDRARYVLSKPLKLMPGERFSYNSGCAMVLSTILTQQTGLSAAEYADRYLFGPIGADSSLWEDRGGISNAANGLILTSRDMARLGLLYLRGGRWGTQQVVPVAWVNRSLRSHSRPFSEHDSTDEGLTPEETVRVGYGYSWFCLDISAEQSRDAGFERGMRLAVGNDNTFVALIPDYDVVVVVTGGTDFVEDATEMLNDVLECVLGAIEPIRT